LPRPARLRQPLKRFIHLLHCIISKEFRRGPIQYLGKVRKRQAFPHRTRHDQVYKSPGEVEKLTKRDIHRLAKALLEEYMRRLQVVDSGETGDAVGLLGATLQDLRLRRQALKHY
ncbi:MAG: hypothetical protein DRN78_02990, partial [Thermoproteota archaeon]